MTEKLFTGTLNKNQNKNKKNADYLFKRYFLFLLFLIFKRVLQWSIVCFHYAWIFFQTLFLENQFRFSKKEKYETENNWIKSLI